MLAAGWWLGRPGGGVAAAAAATARAASPNPFTTAVRGCGRRGGHCWRSAAAPAATTRRALSSTGEWKRGHIDAAPTFKGVTTVAHWTDVEGNWDYFSRLVDMSRAVRWVDDARTRVALNDGCALVFGGDAFDKGPGDHRIARALVGLKRVSPDRTVLLIGNRDVNKMRLPSELHPSDLARSADDIPLPFWFSEKTTKGLASAGDYLRHRGWDDTPVSRLRHMLEFTMGASDTFEFRRQELALLGGVGAGVLDADAGHGSVDVGAVSDDDVYGSFVRAAQPGGIYHEYLAHAQLGCVWGNTLFLHGGMTEATPGYVLPPGLRCKANTETEVQTGRSVRDTHTVAEWMTELERATSSALARWRDDPAWDSEREVRQGEELMAYAHYKATLGRSVMVSTFHSDGNLAVAPRVVRDYLRRQGGVCRTVVGHKPSGELPGVVRSDGFEQIASDTSFSDITAADNRGCAASEVLLTGEPFCNQARIHGTIADGRQFDFCTPPMLGPTENASVTSTAFEPGDPLVGTSRPNGWWVRAPMAGEGGKTTYLTTRGRGFVIDSREWDGSNDG